MKRLFIHAEGQTEETFVREVLAPYLYARGYSKVFAGTLGRGGIRAWSAVKRDILKHLEEDHQLVVSTMVDYYGLPGTPPRGWPGRAEAGSLPFSLKAATVQDRLLADISLEMGKNFNPKRFAPYVVMHEFEALLFSDCERFAHAIERPELAPPFQAIRDAFATPEEIDDSPMTAPSKRVAALIPGYQKPFLGNLAILGMGLDAIRTACPHFANWLDRLESMGKG